MKDYTKQIGKILDMDKVELHYNSEWLDKLSVRELMRISMKFTAQQMIHRRNFKERWDQGKEIGLHELSYPLFQGYDSVAIKADVEIGGSDQLFNVLAGRKMQEIFGQPPQDIMTSKMLTGIDGRKMSTSWGNIITIVDEPNDMYGKVMSMRDECIQEYFELCTQIDLKELEGIINSLKSDKVNPRDVKARLAREIVALYHGIKGAQKAEEEFNRVFREKELPTEIPTIKLRLGNCSILDLLVKANLAPSKSEAKRLILQGGVKINEMIEKDWQKKVEIKEGMVIQAGKRKFVRIKK